MVLVESTAMARKHAEKLMWSNHSGIRTGGSAKPSIVCRLRTLPVGVFGFQCYEIPQVEVDSSFRVSPRPSPSSSSHARDLQYISPRMNSSMLLLLEDPDRQSSTSPESNRLGEYLPARGEQSNHGSFPGRSVVPDVAPLLCSSHARVLPAQWYH